VPKGRRYKMKKLNLLATLSIIICLVPTASCVSKEMPVTETYYETEYRTESYTTTEDAVINIKEGVTDLVPTKQWWENWFIDIDNYRITPYRGILTKYTTKYYGYDLRQNQHSKSQIKITCQPPVAIYGSLAIFDLSDTGQVSSYAMGQGEWGEEEQENIFGTLRSWCAPENLLNTCVIGNKTGYVGYFDSENIEQFAIVLSYMSLAAYASIEPPSVQLIWADQTIEKKTVTKERQVPYQVERQRTVTQTKKVPFWEVIFP
jgi:hypothetical protein